MVNGPGVNIFVRLSGEVSYLITDKEDTVTLACSLTPLRRSTCFMNHQSCVDLGSGCSHNFLGMGSDMVEMVRILENECWLKYARSEVIGIYTPIDRRQFRVVFIHFL